MMMKNKNGIGPSECVNYFIPVRKENFCFCLNLE